MTDTLLVINRTKHFYDLRWTAFPIQSRAANSNYSLYRQRELFGLLNSMIGVFNNLWDHFNFHCTIYLVESLWDYFGLKIYCNNNNNKKSQHSFWLTNYCQMIVQIVFLEKRISSHVNVRSQKKFTSQQLKRTNSNFKSKCALIWLQFWNES